MAQKTLLIGRGLAGSILSLTFHQRGLAHDIIDDPRLSVSSRIAAGVVNPLVLKRLKLVDDASVFLPIANQFYSYWENEWKVKFYHHTSIQHIFHKPGEANLWLEKSDAADYAPYLGEVSLSPPPGIKAPHGLGKVENVAWMDTSKFLKAHLDFHQKKWPYLEKEIQPEDLEQLGEKYDQIFICNGHLLRKLWPASEVAFAPTRGEVMIIESQELPETEIYHGPVFILPLGKHHFKVGATYHWVRLKDAPTADGLAQLKKGLGKIFSGNYRMVKHLAGVRPNTKDRKPLMGNIQKKLYCFNGLGSRGALMAPHLAALLADSLEGHRPIPQKYDLNRFLT